MADKFSSPSSASSGANRSGPQLTIIEQPPRYLYVDEIFNLQYMVEGVSSASSSPNGDDSVQVTLEPWEQPMALLDPAESATVAPNPPNTTDARLHLLEAQHATPADKVHKLQCRISLQSGSITAKQGAAFQLRLSGHGCNTAPVLSRPVFLIQAKLRIETTDEWSNIWFKDEGGRDKCMEIYVDAMDASGKLIKDRIPLTLAICYATADEPIRVMNQDVLRVIGSEKRLQIEKGTGKARVRFRIEDVSKNHQGQDFVLQVSVDRRLFQGIAPAYTPAVSVRSKRNKRHRTTMDSNQPMSDGMRASPPSATGGSEHNPLVLDGSDAETILEAMHGIMKWADDVYNGLHPLQWQVLGYARNEDGSPDYNRPYHSMYNPNATISRIRATYMETTRKQLHILEHSLCRTSSSGPLESYPRQGPHMQPHHDPYWMPPGRPPLQPMIHPLATGMAHRQGTDINFEYSQQQQRGFYGPRHGQPALVPGARYDEPLVMQQAHMWHHAQQQQQQQTPPRMSMAHGNDTDILTPEKKPMEADETELHGYGESDVFYVLAKQYKSLQTRNKLGFPGYSHDKKLLGFFSATSKADGSRLVPIDELPDFQSPEVQQQATTILQDAIDTKSEILYCLRDWGSLGSLLDRVFVYDWSKDISDSSDNHLDSL